jgi:hypothetical protein
MYTDTGIYFCFMLVFVKGKGSAFVANNVVQNNSNSNAFMCVHTYRHWLIFMKKARERQKQSPCPWYKRVSKNTVIKKYIYKKTIHTLLYQGQGLRICVQQSGRHKTQFQLDSCVYTINCFFFWSLFFQGQEPCIYGHQRSRYTTQTRINFCVCIRTCLIFPLFFSFFPKAKTLCLRPAK